MLSASRPSPPETLAQVLAACAAPSALVDAEGRVIDANAAFCAEVGQVARLADILEADHAGASPAQLADTPLVVRGRGDGRLHLGRIGGDALWLAQWLPSAGADSAEQRQLQMFADTVAHDLRSPLRSIDSFAKLLETRSAAKLDASERMHLSRIRAAAGRMSSLLSALGDLSRAASTAMQPGDVDISLLTEWILAELQDDDPAHTVVADVEPGLVAHGDERLLRQLLHSLLHNAWKFTRGCSDARIVLTGRRQGDRLHLQLRDTGCGFDMQYAHKLFQPFQRLHSVEQGAGHGLGLAVARRIAQRHGGSVQAASQVDGGSTFTIELPAAAGNKGA